MTFFNRPKDFVVFLFPDTFFPYSKILLVLLFPDIFFPYSKILLFLLFPDTFFPYSKTEPSAAGARRGVCNCIRTTSVSKGFCHFPVSRHCLLKKAGRLEGLKVGILECWKVGRSEG